MHIHVCGECLTRSCDSISVCEYRDIARPVKAVFYRPREGPSTPLADRPKGLKEKGERIRQFF